MVPLILLDIWSRSYQFSGPQPICSTEVNCTRDALEVQDLADFRKSNRFTEVK